MENERGRRDDRLVHEHERGNRTSGGDGFESGGENGDANSAVRVTVTRFVDRHRSTIVLRNDGRVPDVSSQAIETIRARAGDLAGRSCEAG